MASSWPQLLRNLKGDLKQLYQIKILDGRRPNHSKPIRGHPILAKDDEQLTRWKEHFEEVLDRPLSNNPPILQQGRKLLMRTKGISKTEIKSAITSFKIGKVARVGNISRKPFGRVVRCEWKHCTASSAKSGAGRSKF